MGREPVALGLAGALALGEERVRQPAAPHGPVEQREGDDGHRRRPQHPRGPAASRRRSTTTSAAASPSGDEGGLEAGERGEGDDGAGRPRGPGPGRVERPPVDAEHGGQHEGGVQRVLHADDREPGEEQHGRRRARRWRRRRRGGCGPAARPAGLRQHPHHGGARGHVEHERDPVGGGPGDEHPGGESTAVHSGEDEADSNWPATTPHVPSWASRSATSQVDGGVVEGVGQVADPDHDGGDDQGRDAELDRRRPQRRKARSTGSVDQRSVRCGSSSVRGIAVIATRRVASPATPSWAR